MFDDTNCALNPVAGGDGPMAGLLQSTIEREGLQDRVQMLGAIPSDQVRDVLVRNFVPAILICKG